MGITDSEPDSSDKFSETIEFANGGDNEADSENDPFAATASFGTDPDASRPDPATPQAQQTEFGRYLVRKTLGAGAFGAVYVGFDPQLNREVAIKVPHLAAGDEEA